MSTNVRLLPVILSVMNEGGAVKFEKEEYCYE